MKNGLLVTSIPKASPYFGKLLDGDIIIGVDGQKYEQGMLEPIRSKIISGKIPKVMITVLRKNKEIYFSLIK